AAAVVRLRDEAPESFMRGAKWSRAEIAAQAASVLTAHAQRDAESVKQELLEFNRLAVANPMDCDLGVRKAVDEVRRWQIDAKRQKGEHSEVANIQRQIEEAERILQAGGVAELQKCRTQLASALNLARMKMSNSNEHLKASLQEVLERVDRRVTEQRRSRFAVLAGIILILGIIVVAWALVPAGSQIPVPPHKPETPHENSPSIPRTPAPPDPLDVGTWDPKPLGGDFKLPMPAGGFMVFRRVSLGGDNPHFEFPALSWGETLKVYGPFTSGGSRCYYLGKYEVSEAQFALFASDPGKLSKSAYPSHHITLEMATGFCSKYSTWLADNHQGTLPRSKAERLARVKLPTRDEWEFAARGGSVTMKDARFRASHPYGTDLLSRYECFGGPNGAFNKISEIGTRNGNPLGLFDMLGNVREMSCSKSNRTSALNQNTLMCGGTYFTPEDGLSAGIVQEQPDLSPNDGRPFHQQDLGFRVILTAEESSFDQ
ncbi:MAG: SUMF1/EgtB/PvdO family nonheme iron enzyme, partial [Verrucomicrobiota bacterium]